MAPATGRLLLACGLAATASGCLGMPRASYQAQSNAAYLKMMSPSVAVSANLGNAGSMGPTNLGLQGEVVFQDGAGSVSYHAPTLADLPAGSEVRDVHGRACESGLQIPWGALSQPTNRYVGALWASAGWGDSSYQRALQDAANQVAPGELLYDVRVDLQTISVLSIWRQSCLLVTASALARQPVDPEPSEAGAGELQPTLAVPSETKLPDAAPTEAAPSKGAPSEAKGGKPSGEKLGRSTSSKQRLTDAAADKQKPGEAKAVAPKAGGRNRLRGIVPAGPVAVPGALPRPAEPGANKK